MNIFNGSEFGLMRFNVHQVPMGTKLLDHFKALRQFESFVKYSHSDVDKVIRYIMYMYDKNSPMIKHFTNLEDRMRNSAIMSGFDKEDSTLVGLYNLEWNGLDDMVIDFLKFQNSLKWSQIVTNEHTFFQYQKALLREVINFKDDKNRMDAISAKSKIMEDCEAITARLERLYTEVFSDGDMIDRVKRRRLTPEALADV